MEIILEHFRSFSKRQSIPLRPLTLLVGENSSGKTSLLAAASCIFDAIRFPAHPGFNQAPYNLGTFDTIASSKRRKAGLGESFSIGFASGVIGQSSYREVFATYENNLGNPALAKLKIISWPRTFELRISGSEVRAELSRAGLNGTPCKTIEFQSPLDDDSRRAALLNPLSLVLLVFRSNAKEGVTAAEIIEHSQPAFANSFSLAPIRSKPRRTYDEASEEYRAEGDHIPTLLARLLSDINSSATSKLFHTALVNFGVSSGLFKRISVKRLGKKTADPFQVQVGIAGHVANLSDVGYGVSQALPIVVESIIKSDHNVMLLQQPELHLHPCAEAALGSFFAELAAANDRMFLIETHSDHLVDRVRQEVAKGTIAADKVLILFFHKPHFETAVYPITLDEYGNVEDAPGCYREFFLEEELRLLNRTAATSE